MMNISPMKYSRGISLWSGWSESPSVFSCLKVRTLSAVREAARGQVRMELKAAPAEIELDGRQLLIKFDTDEAEGEYDEAATSQELKYEGPELTDGETLTGSFLVEPGANNEDQDGDGDGRGGGKGDSSLSLAQLFPLRHGAPQEEIVADRGGADQTDDDVCGLR